MHLHAVGWLKALWHGSPALHAWHLRRKAKRRVRRRRR